MLEYDGIALIVVNSVNQALLIKGISLIPTLIQNNLDESLIKCHSINCNLDENVSFQIDSLARERWRKIIKSRKCLKPASWTNIVVCVKSSQIEFPTDYFFCCCCCFGFKPQTRPVVALQASFSEAFLKMYFRCCCCFD